MAMRLVFDDGFGKDLPRDHPPAPLLAAGTLCGATLLLQIPPAQWNWHTAAVGLATGFETLLQLTRVSSVDSAGRFVRPKRRL